MASGLPNYVASAKPVPQSDRIPWYKSTAPTYAGIVLWFVFWQSVPVGSGIGDHGQFSLNPGGMLAHGLGVAIGSLALAALLCHFLYYLVPGLLGMKTGLPLYIVGTSTYGVRGGFLLPGFLMGLLQFGWLSVNAYFSSILLVAPFGGVADSAAHWIVATAFVLLAAILGLKGIRYVAPVATYLPLIPLAILLILFFSALPGLSGFDAKKLVAMTSESVHLDSGKSVTPLRDAMETLGVISLMLTYVLGFFATAGAAGTDFGMNNRNRSDVQLGGLVGVTLAMIVAGGLSLLIVAGAYGLGNVDAAKPVMQTTDLMGSLVSPTLAKVFMWLLALAAFPAACFSSLIAANSFKTTLSKIPPFVSVGIGALAAVALVVTGAAGNVIQVFQLIGASFGPICGAMMADYVLAGMKWAGPRRAFNPAGWISWIVGFIVGAAGFLPAILRFFAVSQIGALPPWGEMLVAFANVVPVPPLSALIVGFLLYYLLARLGLESRAIETPQEEPEAAPA